MIQNICIVIFLCFVFFIMYKQTPVQSSLPFPALLQYVQKSSSKILLNRGAPWILYGALLFMGAAIVFAPEDLYEKASLKTPQNTAYFLLIDISSSMKETTSISPNNLNKIAWAKKLAQQFIEAHKDNPIGIATFARTSRVIMPLTKDSHALITTLDDIHPVTSTENDGTAIGYALFKTANLIVATKYFEEKKQKTLTSPYTMKKAKIIIITDGLQSPNPLDVHNTYRFIALDKAISFCKDHDIATYYLAVDPIIQLPKFSYEIEKTKRLIQNTGGVFDLAQNVNMTKAFLQDVIVKKETSLVSTRSFPVQEAFVKLSMIFLLIGSFIETVLARKGP